MATIQQSMSLYDGVSGPLKQIQQAMALTLNVFEKMQETIQDSVAVDFNTQELEMARAAVNRLGAEMTEIEMNQQRMVDGQDKFNGKVTQSERLMNRLGGAVVVVNQGIELLQKLGDTVDRFMTYSDEAMMINSRIGMMNDGLLEHYELQKKILDMANDTRSGYAETVDMMSKLTMSGAFDNTKGVMDFTEQINKAIRISGGTEEMNKSAMLQLSQALGSGVLQGDELRSLSENAPYLMKVLADGLGVARGELKGMGADGELTTDVIIKAFENQTDVINGAFESIPRTWGDVKTQLENTWINFMQRLSNDQGAGILNPLINQFYAFAEWLNTPQGMGFLLSIATVIEWVTNGLVTMGNIVGTVGGFFVEHWDLISMILLGLATVITGVLIPKLWALGVATYTNVVIPWMMANYPILIVIGTIILLMTILHSLGVTTEQVVGTVTGLFFGLYAFLYNLFADIWNLLATFGEFFANFLNDPIGSVVRLLVGLADFVLGVLETIANAMDALFGSSMADAVSGWRSNMQSWADDTFGEQAITIQRMEKLDVLDNFNKGYDIGIDLSNGATPIFEDLTNSMESMGFEGGHVNSVGSIEDTVDVSNEDLEIMRELAEMESIQNFVTLTPKVNIKTGPVSKEADIDEIVRRIEKNIEDEMEASTKEVYGLG